MRRLAATKLAIFFLIATGVISCNILGPRSNEMPVPVSNTYEYWVTGGFAGSKEHTVIDSTGLAKYTSQFSPGSAITTYTYRMTESELDTLKVAFESANFHSLDSVYQAAQRIMDGFDMSVTWNAGNQSKTVAVEANASVPSGLSSLLRALNNVNTAIQSKGQKS